MNVEMYYLKRVGFLVALVILAMFVWGNQSCILEAVNSNIDPVKVKKKTFIQREAEALKNE